MLVPHDYFDQLIDLKQLAVYVATKTVLFPGLLGFSIGSRASLKAWLAVQDCPSPPRLDKDQEKKLKRKMMAATFLILSGIVGLEFYLFAQANQLSIDRFFTYLFSYVFQVSLMGFFVNMTQATEWTAHRGVAGILHYRPYNLSRPKALVSVVAATTVNIAAYYDAHWAFGSALMVSVVVGRLSNTPARRFSLRGCILCLVAITAAIVTLFCIGVAAANKFMRQVDNGEITLPEDDGEPFEINGFASPNVMKYVDYFITAMYALVPGTLIAGCYRFDYANAVESSPDLFGPVSLKTVEVPANNFRFLSSGVILPSSLPEHFSKPYYTVGLYSFILSHLACAGMFSLIVPFPHHMIGMYSHLNFVLSTIFLLVGLTFTSACRGEFKRFWTYREVWVPKREKGIELPEETESPSTSSMEETLPAYEVVSDVKEPLLDVADDAPAYKV